MEINEHYFLQTLVELKEQVSIHNIQLEEHMRRTAILEEEMRDFRNFLTKGKFLLHLVSIIIGFLLGIGSILVRLF